VARIPSEIALGAAVEPGVLLAEIDPTSFRIEVRQQEALMAGAEAQVQAKQVDIRRQVRLIGINRDKLRLARAEYDRQTALRQRGLIAEQDVEHTELAVRRLQEELERVQSGLLEAQMQHAVAVADAKAAEAALARARQALADTRVRAPFAGLISEKRTTLGEHVAPGTVLYSLADLTRVKIVIRVPAAEVRFLRPDTYSDISVRAFPEPFQGRVAYLGPQADAETRTFPAGILVDNPGPPHLLPGMFARVSVPVRTYPKAILVPRASVVQADGMSVVFVVDPEGGKVHRRVVTIAHTFGSRQLITQGFRPGDLLVVRGQRQLHDGTTVQVAETREAQP
jgi:multidrug efflux pump subunit AcrA (membrane-fusion protein)